MMNIKTLDDYYDLHSRSREKGWPTEDILQDLGLKEVAKELKALGKLG